MRGQLKSECGGCSRETRSLTCEHWKRSWCRGGFAPGHLCIKTRNQGKLDYTTIQLTICTIS